MVLAPRSRYQRTCSAGSAWAYVPGGEAAPSAQLKSMQKALIGLRPGRDVGSGDGSGCRFLGESPNARQPDGSGATADNKVTPGERRVFSGLIAHDYLLR